jgi:Domain of unknown function (DUF427)
MTFRSTGAVFDTIPNVSPTRSFGLTALRAARRWSPGKTTSKGSLGILLNSCPVITYCPYKGDCNYCSVPVGGQKSINAKDPFPAVGQIGGHVAFYPERVDEIAEQFLDVRKD